MIKKKLQILFFIEDMGCGGAEKSLTSLLQLIDYSKIDVDLLTISPNGSMQSALPKEVNLVPYSKIWNPGSLRSKICHMIYSVLWRIRNYQGKNIHKAETLWAATKYGYRTLEKEYDVAIAYQQGLPTYYIANKVRAKKKIAWINADIKDVGYRESFCRKYYQLYDHIVTVSKELYNKLAHTRFAEKSKLTTIYDILSPTSIKSLANEYDVAGFFPPERVRIVTVGRISNHKNQALAVRAARVLKDKGIKFCWCLVGDGPEYGAVSRLINELQLGDYVKLVGAKPNPYPFIKGADIYVQPSSSEGFGLTIAEAKILNKPIVSTNFDVVFDQITDGENGLIADMTAGSVADKIISLINDKELRDKLVANLSHEENTTSQTEIRKFYDLIGI